MASFAGDEFVEVQQHAAERDPRGILPRRRILQQLPRRRGVALEGDVVQRRGAYGTGPSLYLRDPDGHLIELKPRPA